MIISVFLPQLGCTKNPCIFCNQELISDTPKISNPEELLQNIDNTIKDHIKKAKTIEFPLEIALYGSNFTALEYSFQKEILKQVQISFTSYTNKNVNDNLKIRISTRPDYIIREQILDLKIRFNLHTIELGVQSMNDSVLFLANRGHSIEDVHNAVKILKDFNIDFACHQMLGLPGSNFSIELNTAKEIAKLKPNYVRIHPTIVLKETFLEKMYLSGDYIPLNINEALELTEKVYNIYKAENIKIIRIGLNPSTNFLNSIVAGPWHPSFKDLLESKLLYNNANKELEAHKDKKKISITVSYKDEGSLRGKDNQNLKKLKEKYNIEDIEIIKDDNKERGSLLIS